jgi:trans-feruloyl-CoA hydratase/vanillin synthase
MVDLPEYKTILVDTEDGVTTVTFNRPEKRNAMNPQLHRDMYDVITRLEAHVPTRVLVITGSGPSFCAGQDLKEYFKDTENAPYERELNRRISNDWRDRMLRMFPKPTIAMINGYCFGGAFTMVAACDFAISADDAVFGLSEVNWGTIPGALVSKVIGVMMPYRQALYCAMTGEAFDGKRAAELNFVTKSVPADQLKAETMKLANKLARMDPDALKATKEGFKQALDMSYEQAFYWLMSKGDQLRGIHALKGQGSEGLDKFLAKEYRPGFGSYTEAGS